MFTFFILLLSIQIKFAQSFSGSLHEMLTLLIYNDEYGSLQMSILQDAGMDIPGDIARMGCEAPPTC